MSIYFLNIAPQENTVVKTDNLFYHNIYYVKMLMKKFLLSTIILLNVYTLFAQAPTDTLADSKWTYHFQSTVINDAHAGFKAKYSGRNSLADSVETGATTITGTLFLGRRLWKGAAFYFNPEISGGHGLSGAQGVAGALNGESYRVGEADPRVFIARAYLQQMFPIGNTTYEYVNDDQNQIAGRIPTKRLVISAGKYSIGDFYDDNRYSHDPRTQFLNWSLMGNGAWDYPANTRGYTFGLVAELILKKWSFRISSVAVPKIANSPDMEYNSHAHSETLEIERRWSIHNHPGTLRFIASGTYSRAPSYAQGMQALADHDTALLNVFTGVGENDRFGGKKFGLGYSFDQELSNIIGIFSRASWNDGKYATWAFTEIDRTASVGINVKGNRWNRPDDVFGVATVLNGISKAHRDFLAAGGYGFIIGDGQLNYGHEGIIETFYNAKLFKNCWLTADYQFVNHPGYNKDRGPVHTFSGRLHVEF